MNSIGGLSNKKGSQRWSNGLILGGGPVDLKKKTKSFCFENSFHT